MKLLDVSLMTSHITLSGQSVPSLWYTSMASSRALTTLCIFCTSPSFCWKCIIMKGPEDLSGEYEKILTTSPAWVLLRRLPVSVFVGNTGMVVPVIVGFRVLLELVLVVNVLKNNCHAGARAAARSATLDTNNANRLSNVESLISPVSKISSIISCRLLAYFSRYGMSAQGAWANLWAFSPKSFLIKWKYLFSTGSDACASSHRRENVRTTHAKFLGACKIHADGGGYTRLLF